MSLRALCSTSGKRCFFFPAPMMCDTGEKTVGFNCEPCQNCAADGQCLYSMDNSDYFCQSCALNNYKLGSTCTKCYAGSATVLIAPILSVVAIVALAIALYFFASKSPGKAAEQGINYVVVDV